ncbi:MAG: murein hydrolase activator EnvC family protein [Gammaproteobacteria bacterium]
MNGKRRKAHPYGATALLLVVGVLWLSTPPSLGQPSKQETEVQQALQKLRTRIEQLNTQLNAAQTTKTHLEASLRQTERAIGGASNELRNLQHALQSQQSALEELHSQHQTESAALEEQRRRLARQLRVGYAMGQRDMLRVLLNQQEPATVARLVAYHRYITEVRTRQIEQTLTRLERLQGLELAVEKESVALEKLRSEQTQTWRQLEARRANRKAILAELRAKIRQDGEAITHLERDKVRLEELLAGIREALKLSDIPDTLEQAKPFASLKGKLRWPTRGSIKHRFGTPRQPGSLTWKGVWIDSPRSQPIRAVWHGRVAFADWLRGFGLLLIIDHGSGYMSLYAHNESLYKEVGDWVQAGELVATVGDSGGNIEPGLYFEIRHKGIPQNPSSWCNHSVAQDNS